MNPIGFVEAIFKKLLQKPWSTTVLILTIPTIIIMYAEIPLRLGTLYVTPQVLGGQFGLIVSILGIQMYRKENIKGNIKQPPNKTYVATLYLIVFIVQSLNIANQLKDHRLMPSRIAWLQHSAKTGNIAVIDSLLSHRSVYVDAPDIQGCTALMLAAQTGQTAAVGRLLHYGANVRLTDKSGLTAQMFARQSAHQDIATFLATVQ